VIHDLAYDNPDVRIYTDELGMKGKIGAAAVLYRNGRIKTELQLKLGLQCHHTVYKGEGVEAILDTKLVSNKWSVWLAIFYINNQAVIIVTQLTKPTAGYHIFNMLHKHITTLKQKHQGIHIKFK
jgi:hypothetical protein